MASIKVTVTEGVYILNEEEIIYLEASSNYTKLHLTDNRFIVSAKTLKKYEALLPSSIFYRVHSSFLINKKFICKLNSNGNIKLEQGLIIPISRRKKTSIKRVFNAAILVG